MDGMHPLSRNVQEFLSIEDPHRAARLGAWFSVFPTDVQDVLLERARERRLHALVFGEDTECLGEIAA